MGQEVFEMRLVDVLLFVNTHVGGTIEFCFSLSIIRLHLLPKFCTLIIFTDYFFLHITSIKKKFCRKLMAFYINKRDNFL